MVEDPTIGAKEDEGIVQQALALVGPRRALCLLSAFRAENEGLELDDEEAAAKSGYFCAVQLFRERAGHFEDPDLIAFNGQLRIQDVVNSALSLFLSEIEAVRALRALEDTGETPSEIDGAALQKVRAVWTLLWRLSGQTPPAATT